VPTLQPAPRPQQPRRARVPRAHAGGGPLGTFCARGRRETLAECCERLDLSGLETVVGVSNGALIAASLANVPTPVDMGVSFIENGTKPYPLAPGVFLQPAFGAIAARLGATLARLEPLG
jgi:hypothetical protein